MPFVPHFKPSLNAPLFKNGPWPAGTGMTVTITGLPPVRLDATTFGLCGGMAFLTRDIFESGTPQLSQTDSSAIPNSLVAHIMDRLVASFNGPETKARWIGLTESLDHDTAIRGWGVFHQTVEECQAITDDIDAGRLCPIGLVLKESFNPVDVFYNHVELVWGYTREGDILQLCVYDCNLPARDDIFIKLDVSSTTPAKVITTNGTDNIDGASGRTRGFFRLSYTHADPSPAYGANWADIGHANDLVAMAAINNKLFASDKNNQLWWRDAVGHDVDWHHIGHANDLIAMAAINNKLFATDKNNRLWWRDAVGHDVDWDDIGHANDLVAMAAINNKLFAADRNNRLWWRDAVGHDVDWHDIGHANNVVAIAAINNKLFAADTNNRLWWRDAVGHDVDWHDIGHANEVVAMASINNKLVAVDRNNRLWWRDPVT